ncbi:MAG: acyl-CoA thioesterase [Mycetocola sp.]
MHMIFRTLLLFWRSPRAGRRGIPIGHYEVGRLAMRTLPTDLDLNRHMNNGVYLSVLDLGRFDLLIRNGIWDILRGRGWFPVVASETITFRKSLNLWQKFVIETRVSGYDEKAVFVDQRIVVDGEIYAQAVIRARFLKKSGGTVSVAELINAIGPVPADLRLPEWQARWGKDVALPSTAAPAPSEWPGAVPVDPR